MSKYLWGFLRLAVLTTVLAVSGAPAVALAQDGAALDLVRSANNHYDEGRFRDALRQYREAHDSLRDVRLLYRIGLSYEQIGNYQRAREYLARYLREDDDSPVKGRVEAKIDQLRSLEENIQAFLKIETEPSGAQIFIHGYMGTPEGRSPAKIPVGAGDNHVTLVFPEGQRLEVVIDVGPGQTEEKFYQVGTAAAAPPPPPKEVAQAEPEPAEEEAKEKEEPSTKPEEKDEEKDEEVVKAEEPDEEDDKAKEVAEADEEDEAEEEDPALAEDEQDGADEEEAKEEEEQDALAAMDDIIPMPGSERQPLRSIALTRIDMGPPWWATTLGLLTIIGGNLVFVYSTVCFFIECHPFNFTQTVDTIGEWHIDNITEEQWTHHGILWGASALSVGTGIYLLGRNWRKRLPTLQELDFVPEGVGQPQGALGQHIMLLWSGRF